MMAATFQTTIPCSSQTVILVNTKCKLFIIQYFIQHLFFLFINSKQNLFPSFQQEWEWNGFEIQYFQNISPTFLYKITIDVSKSNRILKEKRHNSTEKQAFYPMPGSLMKLYFYPAAPCYLQGMHSMTPSGCLHPQIVPNSIYTIFPYTYLPINSAQ